MNTSRSLQKGMNLTNNGCGREGGDSKGVGARVGGQRRKMAGVGMTASASCHLLGSVWEGAHTNPTRFSWETGNHAGCEGREIRALFWC